MNIINLGDRDTVVLVNKIDFVSLVHESGDWWKVKIGFSQLSVGISFDNESEARAFYENVIEQILAA